MIKLTALGTAGITLALCISCASSSIVVGAKRQGIPPETVRVYLRPPANYEEIALINSNNQWGSPFGEQAKVNTVLARMKNEAAKLGANGLLLQQIGDQTVGTVSSGFATATATGSTAFGYGFGTSTHMQLKTGSAIAIYVPSQSR